MPVTVLRSVQVNKLYAMNLQYFSIHINRDNVWLFLLTCALAEYFQLGQKHLLNCTNLFTLI